jgi:DNA-binding IclR family transcriptional regulator
MGRAFLARCPESEQTRIVEHLAQGDADRASALHAELHSAVESYRRHGYCTSLGEGRPGNHSISVALHLPHLGQRLLLSCGGPAQQLPEKLLHERVAPSLLRSAREIERVSGQLPASTVAR